MLISKFLDFTTKEEGFDNLKQAVAFRDSMGGALFYNIMNDDCLEIIKRLRDIGATKDEIELYYKF